MGRKISCLLKSKIIFIALVLILISCNNNSPKGVVFDKNGNVKEINQNSTDQILQTKIIFENGRIKYLQLSNKDSGQTIWIQTNGKIDQIFNFRNNKKNGHFYSFYESGALKEHRFLRNSREVLYGADYYDDSVSLIKSSLHFNDSGQLHYKKNFDSSGRLKSEEGKH